MQGWIPQSARRRPNKNREPRLEKASHRRRCKNGLFLPHSDNVHLASSRPSIIPNCFFGRFLHSLSFRLVHVVGCQVGLTCLTAPYHIDTGWVRLEIEFALRSRPDLSPVCRSKPVDGNDIRYGSCCWRGTGICQWGTWYGWRVCWLLRPLRFS